MLENEVLGRKMIEENEKERALELYKVAEEDKLKQEYDSRIQELTADYKAKMRDLDQGYSEKKMELDHERSEIKRTVAAYEHSYVPRSDLGSSYVPATQQ